MLDAFNRNIDYLRISVTDLCNYRCQYCMPASGIGRRLHEEILSFEEIVEITEAGAKCGIQKIRLTGGEPLVRKGILSLVEQLGAISSIRDFSMTTNGALLADKAAALKRAGLDRVNISLDTLREDRFRRVTRGGCLADVLAGIDAALEANLVPVKINTVLIRGFNEDEIPDLVRLTSRMPVEVRFIELMPIGQAEDSFSASWLPADQVCQTVPGLEETEPDGGVAVRFRLPDAPGTVGLIRPLSCRFCDTCNRIRLTSDGKLKPCLHSSEEFPLRGLHGEALENQIRRAVISKPLHHHLRETGESQSRRNMNEIGG